jgi:hypothetical protein
MPLNDTRLRTLKPAPGKTDRLVADGNGLYIRVRAGEGKVTRTWQFRRREAGRRYLAGGGTEPVLLSRTRWQVRASLTMAPSSR